VTQYRYKTLINLAFAGIGGDDHAIPFEVEYTVSKGCEATREQPGEGPSVSILKATLTDSKGTRYRAHDWLWEILEADKELEAELIAEANSSDDDAREHRDALRGEHFA
jgi:hypothetical protein